MAIDISLLKVDSRELFAQAAAWMPTILITLYILKAIYRITLHPLARFPRPKLTAMTKYYEAYYKVFVDGTGGKFGKKIEEWHKYYGPIVRINPFELLVDDPDYFDELLYVSPHLWKRTFATGKKNFASLTHTHRRELVGHADTRMQTTSYTRRPQRSTRGAGRCPELLLVAEDESDDVHRPKANRSCVPALP